MAENEARSADQGQIQFRHVDPYTILIDKIDDLKSDFRNFVRKVDAQERRHNDHAVEMATLTTKVDRVEKIVYGLAALFGAEIFAIITAVTLKALGGFGV